MSCAACGRSHATPPEARMQEEASPMFNWTRSREQARQNDATDYVKDLASWAIEHGADNHDFTPEQRERFRLFVRSVNAGVDCLTVMFTRWRVQNAGWRR